MELMISVLAHGLKEVEISKARYKASIRQLALDKAHKQFQGLSAQNLADIPELPYWIIGAFESYFFKVAIPHFLNQKYLGGEVTNHNFEKSKILESKSSDSAQSRNVAKKKFLELREYISAILVSVLSLIWIRYLEIKTGKKAIGIFIGTAQNSSFEQDFRYGNLIPLLKAKDLPVVLLVRSTKAVLKDFITRRQPSIHINILHDSVRLKRDEYKLDLGIFKEELFFNELKFYIKRKWILWLLKRFKIKAAYVANLSGRTATTTMYLKSIGVKIVGSQHAPSMPAHSPCEFLPSGILHTKDGECLGPDVMGAFGDYWLNLLRKSSPSIYREVELSGPLNLQTNLASRDRSSRYVLLLDEALVDLDSLLPFLEKILEKYTLKIKTRPQGPNFILKLLDSKFPHIINHPRFDATPIQVSNNALESNMSAVICTYTSAGIELAAAGFPVIYLNTNIWGDVYEIENLQNKYSNLKFVKLPTLLNSEIASSLPLHNKQAINDFQQEYFANKSGVSWLISKLTSVPE